ncbi:hypothetical protein Sfum_2455 [Syntrophobacter fumaroxidans MPOB]|uniref:Uncharacterized protein n=1 Tax=Syntrophobacter fumaroxidans (strain DSM 10017 / MPOB) TaxID=335543 RepID=A0LL33_SYNFM|nr:hypothetical protein Sfum_2455 [Syntrophobacter fumaroxidans MPOB]
MCNAVLARTGKTFEYSGPEPPSAVGAGDTPHCRQPEISFDCGRGVPFDVGGRREGERGALQRVAVGPVPGSFSRLGSPDLP